jgi:hypothetical protein
MIESIKDLEKLLKLCRKQGVTKIALATVSFELGALPEVISRSTVLEDVPEDPYANFPQGDLTPTQLMFYSSGGAPEDDPELQGETN